MNNQVIYSTCCHKAKTPSINKSPNPENSNILSKFLITKPLLVTYVGIYFDTLVSM